MKNKFAYILFLFAAITAYGQVTLEIVEVKEAKVNQKFALTVLLEISGENMLQETPLRMPDLTKFDIIGTASEQNTVVLDARRGEVVNQLVYQVLLNPKQAGRVKFGSVLVTVNGKIYKTEPFDINVRENERAAIADHAVNDDVYLNMEIQERAVYKNQHTVAVLRAYSRDYDNFRKLKNIQYPTQKNIRIAPVNFAKSEIESRQGLASQVLAVFLIFPSESGRIDINPVSASLANSAKPEKITSNKVRLIVKKLPAGMPENYNNAVGKFDVSVTKTNPDEKPEIEKPLNVTVKISGSGNFASMNLPKIANSENYIHYKPKVTSNTTIDKEGVKGTLTAEYIIVPKKSGIFPIELEKFSFFSPTENKYVDLGNPSLVLDVKTHEEIIEAKSTIEKVNDYTNNVLETVNTPVLQTKSLKIKEKETINWNIVFGNLALLAVAISAFLFARKRIERRKTKLAVVSAPVTTIAETEERIRDNYKVNYQDSIKYLKKLALTKDFENFFPAYDELHSDTKNAANVNSEGEFKKYLERTKGQAVAEDYRKLSEHIRMEKYAPYHTDATIEKLAEDISNLYSEIRR